MSKRGITPQQAKQIRDEKGIAETKLQSIRVKRGLSQSKLAELSGITVRTIQCYEQRARQIDGARLHALCNLSAALDCKIEDILEDKDLIEQYRKVK